MKKNPDATVRSINELVSLDSTVIQIIVDNAVGVPDFNVLDLTQFSKLESLVIGDNCFSYVTEVKMIGMCELESVVIGENSFTQHKNDYGNDSNRHFYVKNCPKLKSLKMGLFSFSDYTVFEIENVDALEVIEMGELNEESYNFAYASLELKSILIHSE